LSILKFLERRQAFRGDFKDSNVTEIISERSVIKCRKYGRKSYLNIIYDCG
jgi:hypothetical protein